MEKNKSVAIAITVIVISSLVLVAVWYPSTVPDARIGYLSQDLHQLALRVAVEKGWFVEEGINVELVQYGNGALEMDGFNGGQIDLGYLGAAPAITKRLNQDIMITILAAVNLEGSAIMGLKSEYDAGRVTTIADLAGKTVYQPGPSTVQNFLLRLALNQSGLTYEDITPETTSPSYMADSLTEDAPAFVAWEPFNARAEYEEKAVPLVQSGDIWPNHPCCVVASTNTFLAEHPDIVQKVIDVHKRAEEWIVANPADAIQIAMDWLMMDETPVTTAFNNIIFDYNLNMTGLERYLSFLIDEGQVTMDPTEIDSFFDSFVNTTFIENAE
ncbi:MAG: putative aliphatic sulfonates-binding protein [Candidatus Thorarchaeota archaeon]|nr:MAG: putative aliphatic sulfonates-binding protein [Candidatus Thorarchaeota archaeon]